MVARGRVRNGVIEISHDIRLIEGQEVLVHTLSVQPNEIGGHGVLDIPPVSLGAVLHFESQDQDLLGEMLEERS